jgi:hypothetical protein
MRKKFLLFILVILFLAFLPSCQKASSDASEVVETPAVEETVTETVTEETDSPDPVDDGIQTVTVCGVEVQWNGYSAIEPDSYLDIRNMDFTDFGTFFEKQYEVSVSSYKIMEGEISETEVVHVHSEKEGPTIYIVGAVHGDEKAAWYTAILMEKATISSGDLYILAPANANGAKNDSRYVTGRQDLNRSFPGDPEGNEAEQLAYAIYSDIEDKNPDLVLDLHEAIVYNSSRDFLGSTYIFTDLSVFANEYDMDVMFLDLLFATEDGTICHNAFGSTGPGPEGSINATVTNELGIPVITVETFRGFDIYRRVYDQLDTIQFILEYLEMR